MIFIQLLTWPRLTATSESLRIRSLSKAGWGVGRWGGGGWAHSLTLQLCVLTYNTAHFQMEAMTPYTKSALAVLKNTLIEICIIFHACVHKRKVCKVFETSEPQGDSHIPRKHHTLLWLARPPRFPWSKGQQSTMGIEDTHSSSAKGWACFIDIRSLIIIR